MKLLLPFNELGIIVKRTFKVLLLSVVLFNVSWGPWTAEGWWAQIREDAVNYLVLTSHTDPLFRCHILATYLSVASWLRDSLPSLVE